MAYPPYPQNQQDQQNQAGYQQYGAAPGAPYPPYPPPGPQYPPYQQHPQHFQQHPLPQPLPQSFWQAPYPPASSLQPPQQQPPAGSTGYGGFPVAGYTSQGYPPQPHIQHVNGPQSSVQTGYAAPPRIISQPSLGYGLPHTSQGAGYDASNDADLLYKAMKGWGTDEKTLIRVLTSKNPVQINILRETYNRQHKIDLLQAIKDDTSKGNFRLGLMRLAMGPLNHDCTLLYKAINGAGTNEEVLNDVLLSRSNADMMAIKAQYNKTYGRDLAQKVAEDLSGETKKMFAVVLNADRPDDSVPVDPQQVQTDITNLKKAITPDIDRLKICSIFANRSDAHIGLVAHTYKQLSGSDLASVLAPKSLKIVPKSHKKCVVFRQLAGGVDRAMRDAELLHETMVGAGTSDYLLVNRVIRMHWDKNHLANVKGAYKFRFKRTLGDHVDSETSGNYKRFLLACLDEPGPK